MLKMYTFLGHLPTEKFGDFQENRVKSYTFRDTRQIWLGTTSQSVISTDEKPIISISAPSKSRDTLKRGRNVRKIARSAEFLVRCKATNLWNWFVCVSVVSSVDKSQKFSYAAFAANY